MADRWVQRTATEYAGVIEALLPTGPAWPRDADGDLMSWVAGCAQIWGNVEIRAGTFLLVESDPRYALEMLSDWEGALGLPDPCLTAPQTIPDRRASVVNKLTIQGGQSRAFFARAAATIGYAISIYEFLPVVCGISRCGETRPDGHLTLAYARCGVSHCGADRLCTITMAGGTAWVWRLGPPELRYYWKVKLLDNRVTWFRCGTGRSGQDHLAEISLAVDLECMIRRWKPAHTTVIFDYTGIGGQGGIGRSGDLDFRIPGDPLVSVL